MGKEIDEDDRRLVKIKPPVEITKTSRSLTERKFWKASEWQAFLLFYSLPVLIGILLHPEAVRTVNLKRQNVTFGTTFIYSFILRAKIQVQ